MCGIVGAVGPRACEGLREARAAIRPPRGSSRAIAGPLFMDGKSSYSLKHQAVIMTVGHLIAYSGSLIAGMILVRMLSVVEFGTFMQVKLIYTTAIAVLVFGLPTSLFYFIPQQRSEEVKRFVVQNFVLLLVIGMVAAGVLYACKAALAGFMHNSRLEELIGYVVLLSILGLLDEMTQPILITIGRADMVAKLNIAATCWLLAFVPIVLWQGYGLEGLFATTAVQYVIKLAMVGSYVLRFPGAIWPIRRFKEVMEQIRYAAPLGFSGVLQTIKPQVEQYMVSFWYPTDMFAIYARGAFNLPVTHFLVANVSNVLLPKFIQLWRAGQKQEMFGLWQTAMRKVSLLTLPVFVYFLLFSEEVIVVLFTEAYRESTIIFVIYLCSMPMELFWYTHVHQAIGATRHILLVNIWSFLGAILLNFVFHSLFGFVGPAIAWVVTKFLIYTYQFVIIAKYFSVSFWQTFPWLHILKILGLCLISGAVVYPLKFTGLPLLIILVLSAAIYGGVYLLVLRKFGYLSLGLKEMVKERFFLFSSKA